MICNERSDFRCEHLTAHVIRSQTTKQFKAICALNAHIRWCLTGTPIQNKLEDLGALVRFLKIPLLENPATFRDCFVKPLGYNRKLCFDSLRTLLGSICLRRTKDLLDLPEPLELTHELQLSHNELVEYKRIESRCTEEFHKSVGGQITAQTQDALLRLFLQLRIFCNNGTAWTFLSNDRRALSPMDYFGYLQSVDQATCVVCSSEVSSLSNEQSDAGSGFLTKCCHLLCSSCFPHSIGMAKQAREESWTESCPCCGSNTSATHNPSLDRKTFRSMPAEEHLGQSTKITALITDLETHHSEAKSIVFSSWKTSLDIVTAFLQRKRIPFNLVRGAMKMRERRDELNQLRHDERARILLMTLGTGAVGLNLANASRIHILEPQWNPAMEAQAIGRAVRLRQEKEVVVIRYIMKKTIEEVSAFRSTSLENLRLMQPF